MMADDFGGGGAPSPPPPPPPPPPDNTAAEAAAAPARKRSRLRKGRAASILAGDDSADTGLSAGQGRRTLGGD